jgi:hypothetical protein
MDIKFSVLLYSKYSKFSKELVDIIENSNVDFINKFQFKTLCIDNENIRKRILNSKNIDIKTVPAILIVYNDGGVEKYEDVKAFEWVENIILQFSPKNVLQHQPIIQQEIQTPILEEQYQNDIDDINNDDVNDISIQQQKMIDKHQMKIQNKKLQQQKIKKEQSQKQNIQNNQLRKQKANNVSVNTNPSIPQNTPLDELEIDDDEQEIFDENDDDDMIINKTPPTINQVESTNAMTVKKNDLMSLASSMQKSRDSFVEKTDRPKFNL